MKASWKVCFSVIISMVLYWGFGTSDTFAHPIKTGHASIGFHHITTGGLPILMYHSISIGQNNLHVPPETFRQQMKWLNDHHYASLSPEQAYQLLASGEKVPKKSVWITFDDGYENNYTAAFPILKQYHMQATIFMIGNRINKKNFLTNEELQEMEKNGVSIESHTMSHPDLSSLPSSEQRIELKNSKTLFEKLLNKKVIVFCYPYGRYDAQTAMLIHRAGYKIALTTWPGPATKKQGMYALHRIKVTPNMSLDGFGRVVDAAQ